MAGIDEKDITRLKLRALIGGIEDIRRTRKGVRMLFSSDRTPAPAALKSVVGTGKPPVAFNAVERLELSVSASREDTLSAALVVLGRLASSSS